MSQGIQPYGEPSEGSGLGPVERRPYSTDAVSTTPLIMLLRRRWPTMLLLWLLLAGILVPCLWLRMKRTYTATAQVQVAPVIARILYHDEDSRVMPFFDSYLNTQAHLISSQQVLMTALADPTIRNLPLLETQNPVAALRGALSIENVPRSNLLEISVTQTQPEAAVALTRAVVEAYMARVGGAEAAGQRKKLEVLENQREQVRAKLDRVQAEIRKLAEEYGTTTDSMFNLLREGVVQATLETKQELERTILEVIQLRDKLGQLEEGAASGVLSDEDAAYREKAIEDDPYVRSLRNELLAVSSRLVQLRLALTEEHSEVIAAQEQEERLKEQLGKERIRAAADADKEMAARRERLMEGRKAGLRLQLKAAEGHQQILEDRIQGEESKGMAIGLRGLEIANLEEERDRLKQDYDQVNEAIKREDIERYRPARVTIASTAELRPEGTKDKRKKWTAVLIVGSLFLVIFAALLKERFGSHLLQAPQQVEAGMGLCVLGVVPCLSDLKSGRTTRDVFIESYRLVRATLSAMGPDGLPPKSILVTSARGSEGKTSLAVSLAASLAESGGRVLLVDSDIQAPQIERLLKLTARGSIEAVLRGQRTLAESVTRSRLPGVEVLVPGTNGETARRSFNQRSAGRLLREAAGLYDHIVIDSSPALSAANPLIWAQVVDGVIISSMASQTDTLAMRLACERLTTVGAKLLGTVVGNVSTKEAFYSYSAMSYGQEDAAQPGARRPGKKRGLPFVPLPDDSSSPQSGDE